MCGRREKNGQNGVGGRHREAFLVIFCTAVTIGIVEEFWAGNNAMKSILLTETFSVKSSGAPGRAGSELFSCFLVYIKQPKRRRFGINLGGREEPVTNSDAIESMS
jgi:hypothetical protein